MTSTDLPFLLQRFTMRYRAALLAKTGLLAALGLALAAALAWRLFMLGLGALWRLGVPAAVAIATGASLGWWAHARWPSRRASAAYLDRLLGLKQRLVTAEEFSGAPNAPALYPLLVADASKWVADGRTRYPRPLDRAAAVLLVLLLLALAWPLGGRSPLQQLAQLPKPSMPPMKPPEPLAAPPTAPQNRQPQAQQGGAGQQPSPSSSAGSQGQQGQNQSQGAGRDQTGGSEGSSNDGGATPDRSGGGQQGAGQRGAQSADSASGGERGQGQSGQGQGQQPSSGQSQGAASGDAQGGAQDGTQGAAQQARASAGGKSGGDAQAGAGHGQSVEATAARAPSGGGSSGSPGNEALQQDIQQLLKDVSGEIHTLQAQIAAAKGQPPPTAGTTTDPELYGALEPLGQTGAGNIPIQLKTDTAETTSRARAGSGVGRPSGEVTAAAPSAIPEPAQLSDDPLEEPPGSRDTVPPEYRDVFDRLNRRAPSGI